MFKTIRNFVLAFVLGGLCSVGAYYFYTASVIQGHLDAERASDAIIGQLRSEHQRAVDIVSGLELTTATVKDALERQRQISKGLRKLVELYFP